MRVNLSVAIVSMVKYKSSTYINITTSECIEHPNQVYTPVVEVRVITFQ